VADGKFGDIINFDHEDRQIMNLMKYYGLAQYQAWQLSLEN
jgi:hypothetical protein